MRNTRLPNFKQRLDAYSSRVGRPVLQGEIALEIGCSLAQVEREMEHIVDSGEYVRLSKNELKAIGLGSEVIAFKPIGNKLR